MLNLIFPNDSPHWFRVSLGNFGRSLGDLWGIFGELWGSFGGKPLGSLGEFVILKKEPQGTDLLALLAII